MSSSDEDRPPRDPLLDDPAFAELVGPPPAKPAEPVFAEPVEAPIESLPVAEVVRPKAKPVAPAAPNFPPKPALPPPTSSEPPKPQWFAACSVIGCLGGLFIGAIALLIWIAITLLSNIGDKLGDVKPTSREAAPQKAKPGPIAPTALVNDVEIPLSGRIDAVARGGFGRFLLLRSTNQRKIEVFDTNTAQIAYSIPSGEPGTLFAAGSDKIFVCDPIEGKLMRYGLFTGELELTEKLPDKTPLVRAIAVGGGASGPVRLIQSAAGKLRIQPFDPATFRPLKSDDFPFAFDATTPALARASDNGSVLGVSVKDGAAIVWYGSGNPTSKLLSSTGAKPRWVVPAPDGQFLYTPRGVYDTDGGPFAGTRLGLYSFPPAHGDDWFLTLDESDDSVSGAPRRQPAGERDLAKSTQLEKAFLTDSFPANELKAGELTAADRIHYWPGAGLVAVLPPTPASAQAKLQLFKVAVSEK